MCSSTPCAPGKYLRVRGEEGVHKAMEEWELEIPPRARRRVEAAVPAIPIPGNTSACAEKSRCGRYPRLPWWKYLRVRGEEPPPQGRQGCF